jgi:hypothetical protein
MSKLYALNAEISECEKELRCLGTELKSIVDQQVSIVVDIDIYYLPAVNDYWASRSIQHITGQYLHGQQKGKVQLKIRFDKTSQPVAVIFANGIEWAFSSARWTGGINWIKFLRFYQDRPVSTRARIDSFDSRWIDLTVETIGPYESYNGDDLTDTCIVSLSFRPR